ncbi:MAG: LptF/LptG family permease [Candidatus Kapabacteria bacterium]|nr:LptF/LptG family permease [Candidatus Kapabacteria bacterium]
MSYISLYILRFQIGPFLFGSLTVVFLFLFQFLSKYLNDLVIKGLETWVIFQLIALNVAWMIVLAIPMGVLFAALMSFGNLSSTNEITIIKSSGGSLLKMMSPVIVTGILMTIFLFWFNDNVLPEANHQAKVLLSDIERKKPTFSLEAGQFSTQLDGYTILARKIDSITGHLKALTIYDRTKGNRLSIASADSGSVRFNSSYTKIIIDLFNGEAHQLSQNDYKDYRLIKFKEYQVIIPASGFAFERTAEGMISRGDREMKISDMQKIVDEAKKTASISEKKILENAQKFYNYLVGISPSEEKLIPAYNYGKPRINADSTLIDISGTKIIAENIKTGLIDAERRISTLKSSILSDFFQARDYYQRAKSYEVEIHKKYAIPFACILFVLIGCPLGIITKNGNFGISAAISLGFYIFYWACLIGGEKLADRGLISPFISMWAGNFIIAVFAVIILIKVNNESASLNIFRYIKNLFMMNFSSVRKNQNNI